MDFRKSLSERYKDAGTLFLLIEAKKLEDAKFPLGFLFSQCTNKPSKGPFFLQAFT